MTERRAITIQGTVQGVGFRPFVHALASRLQLGGLVRNQVGGIHIEVEGEMAPLDQFLLCVVDDAPPLAHIDALTWQALAPTGDRRFHIEPSRLGVPGPVTIAPDAATCEDCLRELFDPRNRRYRYPFINCTNCGPRLTIVREAPYDRARTTMSGFALCADCRREYENPADRRFHAEPIACARCGPRLRLLGAGGEAIAGDALNLAAAALAGGKIVAVKGLGGYHLACRAEDEEAVAALRQRKHREEKPFAVMVKDFAAASVLCDIGEAERKLLESRQRPIVLLNRREGAGVADAVAPDNPTLGIMLPYTPLHHLLMHELPGAALVMTSGNRSDEPIAVEDRQAIDRLAGIADFFLAHDRAIHVRCDDSVTRVMGGAEAPIRRSRGYAPQPLAVPFTSPAVILAVGGQLKGTFALGAAQRAIVSHHLGDLEHREAAEAFQRDITLYEQLFGLHVTCIAHDLHPDYASSRYAVGRANAEGMECIAVQHHHAHMASCMAENGVTKPIIGVTFDGAGLGDDGAIWGGEFLVGDFHGYQRRARLRYVPMPGGEAATRNPWRMAVSHLADAGVGCDRFERRQPVASLRTVRRMLERGINSPLTSSMGRLFDAVAALAGVRDSVTHEGQAAMQLEWLATPIAAGKAYPVELTGGETIEIDTRPMIRAAARDVEGGIEPAVIARRFHSGVVEMICRVCVILQKSLQLNQVAFSGGAFMNALLSQESARRLAELGFVVYSHRRVPANDGGLSLGQLAIAANRQRSP